MRAGHTYLVAAAVKCRDVRDGEVQVHAHRLRADGRLVKHEAMTSVGPAIRGTTDWTLMSGLMTMPPGTAALGLHLTTDRTGTVWHDAVMVTEVVRRPS